MNHDYCSIRLTWIWVHGAWQCIDLQEAFGWEAILCDVLQLDTVHDQEWAD